jgi:hypothetical protein
MQLRILSFQKHKRMSVVQFLDSSQDTFKYISGPAAMKNDLIKVKEVNQSGSVNELFVFNLSEDYVFFMDGDILTGAKQNRVLNTSVLLAPNSKVTLPVSCVEQGRWDNHFSDFQSSNFIVPQKLRANKAQAVKESREMRKTSSANQSQVWNDVSDYSAKLNCFSETSSLSDIYEKKKKDLDAVLKSFLPDKDANGMAVFSERRLLCTDIFNRKEIYNEYFPKILRSSAMEILSLQSKENKLTEAEAAFKTLSLFDSISAAEVSVHPGVGAGEEKRFQTNEVTGFTLEFKKHLIHLTALNIQKEVS